MDGVLKYCILLPPFGAPGALIISLLLPRGSNYLFKIRFLVFFPSFAKLRAQCRGPVYFSIDLQRRRSFFCSSSFFFFVQPDLAALAALQNPHPDLLLSTVFSVLSICTFSSSFFSCSCVERFQLLVCHAFSVVHMLSALSQSNVKSCQLVSFHFSCVKHFQLLACRAFSIACVLCTLSLSYVKHFQLLVCREFLAARMSCVSISRVSSFFFCWCVKCFRLLMCQAFSVAGVSCVFISRALSVARASCVFSRSCRVFFIRLRQCLISVCQVLVSGVSGGLAVCESFPWSVRTTCALVTCVSCVQLSRGPGVKFPACHLFSFRVRLGLSTFSVFLVYWSFVLARLAVSAFNLRSLEVLPFVFPSYLVCLISCCC